MSWRDVVGILREYCVYAPDMRGYGDTERPKTGYDVFTLTDDIKELIAALGLQQPAIVSHDWGGELGWIFAHRYSDLIRKLVVVNGTHPKTLVRAVFHLQDFQTFRIPWVPFFEIPWLPEHMLATPLGRKALKWSTAPRLVTRLPCWNMTHRQRFYVPPACAKSTPMNCPPLCTLIPKQPTSR